MKFVSNRFFLLIPRSVIPSAQQGNDADPLRIVEVRGHLWNCKTSIASGKFCHSLRNFCLTIVTIWMTTRMNCDDRLTGSFARTLIDKPSTTAWLNITLGRLERKEALMRIRVQVLIESDQEA